jgi:hypothetical protein
MWVLANEIATMAPVSSCETQFFYAAMQGKKV